MKLHQVAKFTSVAVFLALSGCASSTQSRMGDAALAPLSDLHVVRADIPDVLASAQKQPYRPPADQSCAALAREIARLDQVLGADLDTPESDDRPSMIDRTSGMVGNQAVSAMQRTTQGLMPFRGWVRKLSGAERYADKVAASITAGAIRRAYLKGHAASKGCEGPATKIAVAATTAEGVTK